MAHPYLLIDKKLHLVSGVRAPVVLAKPVIPKPPIRQLPLPKVLVPGLRGGK